MTTEKAAIARLKEEVRKRAGTVLARDLRGVLGALKRETEGADALRASLAEAWEMVKELRADNADLARALQRETERADTLRVQMDNLLAAFHDEAVATHQLSALRAKADEKRMALIADFIAQL